MKMNLNNESQHSPYDVQGEYQEEVQTLDYDVHISKEGKLSELGN